MILGVGGTYWSANVTGVDCLGGGSVDAPAPPAAVTFFLILFLFSLFFLVVRRSHELDIL